MHSVWAVRRVSYEGDAKVMALYDNEQAAQEHCRIDGAHALPRTYYDVVVMQIRKSFREGERSNG